MASETFEEIKMEDVETVLAHHGVLGMKWGKHNEETMRKYGELGPKTERKTSASDTASDSTKKPSLAKRGFEAIKKNRQAKKDAKAAEEQRIKEQKQEEEEFISKYGMTKEKYEAVREATLNSHDPQVVAKGMHLLTDEELRAKIERLETEEKLQGIANREKQAKIANKKAELDQKKQTLPYRLGERAANAIVDTAVNKITQNAVAPIASAAGKALGDSGAKAIEALKKSLPEQKETVQKAIDDTKEEIREIKQETATKREQAAARKEAARTISDRSKIESSYGETLYSRMKSANKENVDKDDPSRRFNYKETLPNKGTLDSGTENPRKPSDEDNKEK